MYICDFSRSVGAGSATTRNTRGLTRSVIRLIVPPLPAVSRPSKTMQIFAPVALTHSCMATSSPCSRRISRSYSLRFILPASTCGRRLASPRARPSSSCSRRALRGRSIRGERALRVDRGRLPRRAPAADPLARLDHERQQQRRARSRRATRCR